MVNFSLSKYLETKLTSNGINLAVGLNNSVILNREGQVVLRFTGINGACYLYTSKGFEVYINLNNTNPFKSSTLTYNKTYGLDTLISIKTVEQVDEIVSYIKNYHDGIELI